MKSLVILSTLFVLATSSALADGFNLQLKNPNVTISIPDLPQVQMNPHPMREQRPHLRYAGELDPFVISVIATTADAGTTAMECGNSSVGPYLSRTSLKDSQYATYQISENTVLFEYISNQGDLKRLHSHLFSAYKGRNCINVHISRNYTSDEDIDVMNGRFDAAVITEY